MIKTYVKICDLVQTIFTGNSNVLFNMAESLYPLKESFIVSIVLCVRIKIDSCWHSFVV